MIAHKHITKIIAVIMALAVCLCLVAVAFSDQIKAVAGDAGISMEYETALFDTDSVISVNILMDEDDWEDMLDNAMSEEYHKCNVEINGKTFYQVAIRPKGNTSLSSIASDPTTDRYSFKLEFDHYVDGQTCFGLDKLILNNNYADATNMKEALIYDMYQYLGADASLYNYAEISVNGEYWGVYLALEAVEDSFLMRNYGTQNGELYKPESMDMGGAPGGDDMGDKDFADKDFANKDSNNEVSDDSDSDNGEISDEKSSEEKSSDEETRDGNTSTQDSNDQESRDQNSKGKAPANGNFANMTPPDFSDADDNQGKDFSGFPGGNLNFDNMPDMEMPDMDDGGFSMGGNGADLNYSDDDLDSYSTIWDGEITNTKKADHKRVVTALKNISEGNDLESYMDINNLFRYMAVHIFSVNEDSLSGTMAHNYYLYESSGKLNLIPWDYNLSFGGMGNNNATDVVNDAIDNAFSSTDFFDTLMDNATYHDEYYSYLQQLVESYVNGGAFDAFYERVRSQIDELVKNDPTAFYSYEEYETAADTLYQIVKLRGESIQGQIDGTIPSTEEEQKNSDSLIDASALDLSTMGSMDAGGGKDHGNNPPTDFDPAQSKGEMPQENPDSISEETSGSASDEGLSNNSGENSESPSDDVSNDTSDNNVKNTQDNNISDDTQEKTPANLHDTFSENNSQTTVVSSLILYGISFLILIAALIFAVLYHRRIGKK